MALALRKSSVLLPLACLVGCDGVHPLLFPETPSLPLNFRERLFLTKNSASDLLVDTTADLASDLSTLRSFRAGGSLSSLAAQRFLDVEQELEALRSRAAPLPQGLPAFPSAPQKKRALEAIANRADVPAVSPLAALTASDQPPLFVRRQEPWGASGEQVQVWKKEASPYVARVIDLETRAASDTAAALFAGAEVADFESADLSETSLTTSNFYARSLFEPRRVVRDGGEVALAGEAFQMSIQCAKLRYSANGTQKSAVWPRVVIFESGTGTDVVVRHTVLRNELFWDAATGALQLPTTPTLVEVVRRTVASLFVHAARRAPHPSRQGDAFWYAREASTLFFSRFGALLAGPTLGRQLFTSFQAGVNALELQAIAHVLADGTLPSLAEAQTQWLATEGDAARKDRGSDDAWVSGLEVHRVSQGDWRKETDFQRNGLHAVDWSHAGAYLMRDFEPPAAFSGAFPFSQKGDVEAFCAATGALP